MPFELSNDDENKCIMLSQNSFAVRETFGLTFMSDDESIFLINTGSCCNGVICLSGYEDIGYGIKLFLFKPSIRKLRPIPSSSTESRIEKLGVKVGRYLGFGYDQITDDYKVVRLYRICKGIGSDSDVDEFEIYKFDVELEAEVYSLRSDSWKTVEVNDHRYFAGRSVLVNNSTHWLSNADDGLDPELIVAFDFSVEVFREMALPIGCGYGYSYILLYKGSLAILELEEIQEVGLEQVVEDVPEEEQEVTVSLWVMKEYGVKVSWCKEFTGVMHRSFDVTVGFTKNGKLIFQKTNSELAAWDPESGQVVDFVGFSEDEYIVVEDYIESLILI